jgi:NDP-sugar pyrophosphorylase family protein
MKAIVLAAGVGSRLDPLTTQVPKPLVPVANTPVMEHILLLLKRHGISEIASNLHYLPDQVRNYFGDGSKLDVELGFHFEETLSGDAGGVRALRNYLDGETFIVMMGDLLTDADLTYVINQHKSKGALATIALKQVDDVSQFGVALLDSQSFIKGFQEKPAAADALSNLASTGIYILEHEIFKHIPENGPYGFGRQLFPTLVDQGLPVLGVEISNYWSDVGTVKQYRLANFDALDGRLQVDLKGQKSSWGYIGGGSTVDDGVEVEGLLLLGENSHIAPGVKVRGKVVVGDNCIIEAKAELEDTVIWSNVNIEARAVVRDSVIGRNCMVKNGSRQINKAVVDPGFGKVLI